MTDSDLERRLERLAASYADRPVDTAASWRRLTRARTQAARARRRVAAVAAAGVTVVAIAIPAVAYQLHSGGQASPTESRSPNDVHLTITARIAVPGAHGAVGDEAMTARVVAIDGQVWAMTYNHRLIRIDPTSNRVIFDKHVAGLTDLAVGVGTLWALVTGPVSGGHLLKLDPVTLRVLASFKVPRMCRAISFGGGQLWTACGGELMRFLRIDPSTGHVLARSGLASSVSSIAATADGIWYAEGNTGVSGYVETGSRLTWVRASDAADLAFTDSLVYANGSLWAFDSGENVARVSPVTGRITKVYSAARYDPQNDLGLNFFAVDRNSIWFLSNSGYRATAVLRVSLASGRPQGQVSKVGSCGEPCWQIYLAGGSVWVPTRTWITRIDSLSPRRPRRTGSR